MTLTGNHHIPYGSHTITEEDIAEVVDVLRNKFLTQGDVVPSFESSLAKRVCATYSVAVNSATSALHLACLSLDVGPGDFVWTVPTTFVASANCALYCGASIDFVDIDPDSGLMSLSCLEEKLISSRRLGTLPKAIIPVHLAGKSCDMKSLYDLVSQYGIKIIEDASHALGATYKGRPVGSCEFSDATVFSFHPVKMITTGEGGMLVTNNASIASKARQLRSHGIVKDRALLSDTAKGDWYYEQHLLGFNYRLSDIQAALGLSQLKRLDQFVMSRNALFSHYIQLLKDTPFTMLDSLIEDDVSSLHLGVVRIPSISANEYLSIFTYMRSNNIGVQLHYSPVHLQPFYQRLGFTDGDFPASETYAHTCLSLPLYVGLSSSSQAGIIETLKQAYLQRTK